MRLARVTTAVPTTEALGASVLELRGRATSRARLKDDRSFAPRPPTFLSQRNLGGGHPNLANLRGNSTQVSRNKLAKIANETLPHTPFSCACLLCKKGVGRWRSGVDLAWSSGTCTSLGHPLCGNLRRDSGLWSEALLGHCSALFLSLLRHHGARRRFVSSSRLSPRSAASCVGMPHGRIRRKSTSFLWHSRDASLL